MTCPRCASIIALLHSLQIHRDDTNNPDSPSYFISESSDISDFPHTEDNSMFRYNKQSKCWGVQVCRRQQEAKLGQYKR